MKKMLAASTLLTIFASVIPAWGHGTEGFTQNAQGIQISAEYDDGEPMSYSAVEITGPDSVTPFQKGRTDRNGMFMFLPDRCGKWLIVVRDQLGHRLALERQVTNDNGSFKETGYGEALSPPTSQREGIIAGISIIFGLSGLAYGWKARSR